MGKMILGISSAMNTIGAALVNGRVLAAESSISGEISRSEKLIKLIDDVLKRTGVNIKKIDAVAVTSGPGSYSGLRGGIATVKGLVHGLDIPVISVPTLEASAYNMINNEGTSIIILHACKDEFNLAVFASHKGKVKRLTKDMTVTIDNALSVIGRIEGPITVVCDRDISDKIDKENVKIASFDAAIPWARNVAVIGAAKYITKDLSDVMELVPQYSHKPNIREYKK